MLSSWDAATQLTHENPWQLTTWVKIINSNQQWATRSAFKATSSSRASCFSLLVQNPPGSLRDLGVSKTRGKMEPSFQRKFAKFTNRKNPSKYMQIHAYFRPPEWGTFFGQFWSLKKIRERKAYMQFAHRSGTFSGQSWTQKFKPNQKWPQTP